MRLKSLWIFFAIFAQSQSQFFFQQPQSVRYLGNPFIANGLVGKEKPPIIPNVDQKVFENPFLASFFQNKEIDQNFHQPIEQITTEAAISNFNFGGNPFFPKITDFPPVPIPTKPKHSHHFHPENNPFFPKLSDFPAIPIPLNQNTYVSGPNFPHSESTPLFFPPKNNAGNVQIGEETPKKFVAIHSPTVEQLRNIQEEQFNTFTRNDNGNQGHKVVTQGHPILDLDVRSGGPIKDTVTTSQGHDANNQGEINHNQGQLRLTEDQSRNHQEQNGLNQRQTDNLQAHRGQQQYFLGQGQVDQSEGQGESGTTLDSRKSIQNRGGFQQQPIGITQRQDGYSPRQNDFIQGQESIIQGQESTIQGHQVVSQGQGQRTSDFKQEPTGAELVLEQNPLDQSRSELTQVQGGQVQGRGGPIQGQHATNSTGNGDARIKRRRRRRKNLRNNKVGRRLQPKPAEILTTEKTRETTSNLLRQEIIENEKPTTILPSGPSTYRPTLKPKYFILATTHRPRIHTNSDREENLEERNPLPIFRSKLHRTRNQKINQQTTDSPKMQAKNESSEEELKVQDDFKVSVIQKRPQIKEDSGKSGKEIQQEIFEKQAQDAKYSFSSDIKDDISSQTLHRAEERQDGKVTGKYSYSDGFVRRTVHYEADDKGYRVVKEEQENLGNGPQINPKGNAEVQSVVGGNKIHYSISTSDIKDKRRRNYKEVDQEEEQSLEQDENDGFSYEEDNYDGQSEGRFKRSHHKKYKKRRWH